MTSPPTLQLDNTTKFSPMNDDPPKIFKLARLNGKTAQNERVRGSKGTKCTNRLDWFKRFE